MDDNQAKTISTMAIWIATACIFIFGVFRFSADGFFPVLFWMLTSLALAVAPAVGTQAIWKSQSSEKPPETNSNKPLTS